MYTPELLGGVHVFLHVFIAPEEDTPHLVRQESQEEIPHETTEAPQ
jgi:hypothetical protein